MVLKTDEELKKERRSERRKLRRQKRKAEAAGLDPNTVSASSHRARSAAARMLLPPANSFYDQVIKVLEDRFSETYRDDPGDDYWYSFSTDLCRDLTPDDAVDAMITRLEKVGVKPTQWVKLSGHIVGFGPSLSGRASA